MAAAEALRRHPRPDARGRRRPRQDCCAGAGARLDRRQEPSPAGGCAKPARFARETVLEANARDVAEANAKDISKPLTRPPGAERPAHRRLRRPGWKRLPTLPDPVGEVFWETERPNGLRIERVRVPLGVIGIIYESRPERDGGCRRICASSRATPRSCAAARRAFTPARRLWRASTQDCATAGLPEAAIQLVPTRDRAAVGAMLTMSESHQHHRAARRALAD